MDVTPPTISILVNPSVSNANISFSWESYENVTWECILLQNNVESAVCCSEGYWRGYGLSEGLHHLYVSATDVAGNTATVMHTFEIDLTPPTSAIIMRPSLVSSQQVSALIFSCSETCSFECHFMSNTTQESYSSCNNGLFVTPTLQPNTNYTFVVIATDQVGNTGESVSYMWETDFEAPSIFGIQNTSASCQYTSPEYTGQAQAVDNRRENISLTFSDIPLGCYTRRTWTATDAAGNVAQLVQHIDLEFSPSVSLLPQVILPCDSTDNSNQVTSSTAFAPNPCGLPLQLTYQDSTSVHTCPSEFSRNWTVSSCGRDETISQTIVLFDLCPPQACGRNESIPQGTCSLGDCLCNRPWYGEDCSTAIYEPIAEPVSDTILQESQQYTANIALSQGSPPLSWILESGPDLLQVNQYTGQVMWRSA